MRNQLGAKWRRLLDEILLDRHGASPFGIPDGAGSRSLDCHINTDTSRWPNSSVSANDCSLGKPTDESLPRNVSELVRTSSRAGHSPAPPSSRRMYDNRRQDSS
jgi:hypothetical protein